LIVDDIREIRRLTGHLVSQCHATVAYAENGVKALEAVLQAEEDNEPFHLVLMDIHMPVMNGIEALHAIRRHKSNVPVVAVTAASRKGLKQSLMNDGFNNVIGKPIERAALTEVLDQYLVRSQGPAVSKIETVKTVTQCTQPQPTAKKVLVIEDDEDAAELLQLFLVHQGHDVITANTGADAIECMNEVVFDHVLMDLTLPDYHGYDLAAELNQIQPKAKLVIVSGNEPDRDTMKHLGVSQSLLKPVSKEDLISVVS
jgi:CheY-like chemotaxis protein